MLRTTAKRSNHSRAHCICLVDRFKMRPCFHQVGTLLNAKSHLELPSFFFILKSIETKQLGKLAKQRRHIDSIEMDDTKWRS